MGRTRPLLAAVGITLLTAVPFTAGPLTPGAGAAAATLDLSKLPSAMHAEVENKAVILGTGAQALFVDPGPAYSLANIDYTRYDSETPPDFAMKARGAVLDPGTIAAAVLWAAPHGRFPGDNDLTAGDLGCGGSYVSSRSPNTQCMEGPTGLHEASGWPGYAEAFYPDANDINRQHTAKCPWSKDANEANPTGGSIQDTCRNDAEATPAYAVADTWADRLESRGFTRDSGATGSELLSIGASEALSDVKPTPGGKLIALGYASAKNISLANGVVQIHAVKASAEIDAEAGSGEPDVAKAACTATGVSIAGTDLPVDAGKQIDPNRFKPLHDAARAQGFEISITPPGKPVVTTDASGKHTVSCTGMQLTIDDLRDGTLACAPQDPPQPIPGVTVPRCLPKSAGNRNEYTFGAIRITASANDFDAISADTGDAASDLGAPESAASTSGAPTVDLGAGSGSSDLGASLGASSVPSALGPTTGSRPRTPTRVAGKQITRSANLGGPKPISQSTVAALTATTALAIGGGVWLLIGVVMALAQGTRLRLPGTRLR